MILDLPALGSATVRKRLIAEAPDTLKATVAAASDLVRTIAKRQKKQSLRAKQEAKRQAAAASSMIGLGVGILGNGGAVDGTNSGGGRDNDDDDDDDDEDDDARAMDEDDDDAECGVGGLNAGLQHVNGRWRDLMEDFRVPNADLSALANDSSF